MTLPTPEPRGEPLSYAETQALSRLVTEHGDVAVAHAAGVAPATVGRAVAGLGLYRRPLAALRAFVLEYMRAA